MGVQQRPPIDPPAGLRPFVRFQKLPDGALEPIRRAVESDHVFRARLAAVADEDIVGRAGWLWLVRPEGWSAEFDALRAAGVDVEGALAADRKRSAAERAAREAKAELVTLKTALARVAVERDDLAAANARLLAQRTESEAAITKLRKRLARLEAGSAEHQPPPPPAPVIAPVASPVASPVAAAGAAPIDAARVNQLAQLAQLAEQASATIAELRTLLPDLPSATKPRRTPRPKRAEVAPPPGMRVDSDEAVVRIVSRPDLLILVDGYNVAKLAWPSATVFEQRDRLIDAIDAHVARTRSKVHVVFDGAEVGPAIRVRRRVPVTFSPAGITADDVLVELIDAIPLNHALAVVTSDRALRHRAGHLGALTLHSHQFFDAITSPRR